MRVGPGASRHEDREQEVAGGEDRLVDNVDKEGPAGDVSVIARKNLLDTDLKEPAEELICNFSESEGRGPLTGNYHCTHAHQRVGVLAIDVLEELGGDEVRDNDEDSGGTEVQGDVVGDEDSSEVGEEAVLDLVVLVAELRVGLHGVLHSLVRDVDAGHGADGDGDDHGEAGSHELVGAGEALIVTVDSEETEHGGKEDHDGGRELVSNVDVMDLVSPLDEVVPGPAAASQASLGEVNELAVFTAFLKTVIEVKGLQVLDECDNITKATGAHYY